MELTLTQQVGTQVCVACEGHTSHTFDLQGLLPERDKDEQALLDDPIAYGRKLYGALFPPHSFAQYALAAKPRRILLVCADNHLDEVPWEYLYGSYGADDQGTSAGFLVLECCFVRGLPEAERINSPRVDTGLHIIAVPSNPLSCEIQPLDVEGEWIRLRDVMEAIPYALTLERVRPPTLERVRQLVANQKGRVVHFMGHGGQGEKGALLCFEQENGDLEWVTAEDLTKRLRETAFLVTLNACVSAQPGPLPFSNLAAALIRQKTPYALGMRSSIVDTDAHTFSRTFYSELARGCPLEDALLQARLGLARSPRRWVVGVPVLYTALVVPATGFACTAGNPTIKEYRPPVEISALPRAEGTFQGRIQELKQLATYLVGDRSAHLVTIHGVGGQGKTALVREFIERFAYAWNDGVWAVSLENMPDQYRLIADLARFLGLDINILRRRLADITPTAPIDRIEEEVQRQLEQLVLAQLAARQMLLVLDNAETLIEGADKGDPAALRLAQFIRQKLRGHNVSLLVTSRYHLGWVGEDILELGGLSPLEGARLFRQSAPSRQTDASDPWARQLSEKVAGQPLSLRLLGGVFDSSGLTLTQLLTEYEAVLSAAENRYAPLDDRHRSLFASIETGVRYLSDTQRALLRDLCVFRAPFLAETAAAIFDSGGASPSVHDHVGALWRRGFLAFNVVEGTGDKRVRLYQLYHLLPTTRLYLEHFVEPSRAHDTLMRRYCAAHYQVVTYLWNNLGDGALAALAQTISDNIEHGWQWLAGTEQVHYLMHWGFIVHRWGNPVRGLALLEHALQMAQGIHPRLEIDILHRMTRVYQDTHHLQEALQLGEQVVVLARRSGYQQFEASAFTIMGDINRLTGQPEEAITLCRHALTIAEKLGDKSIQATALNNLSLAYTALGQPHAGLALLQQALPLEQDVGDLRGEAFVLNNMAYIYKITEQPQEASCLYKRALRLFGDMGDQRAQAMVLSNLAAIHQKTGELQEAIRLSEEALAIRRATGDEGTADVLSNLALLHEQTGQYSTALDTYHQAVAVAQQLDYPAAAGAALANMAMLLYYRATDRGDAAVVLMEQTLDILEKHGLPVDACGRPVEELHYQLRRMKSGVPPVSFNVDDLVADVIEIVVEGSGDRSWCAVMSNMLGALRSQYGEEKHYQEESELFTAVRALLDGGAPTLPAGHRYAWAVERIKSGITSGRRQPIRIAYPVIDIVSGDVVRFPPVMQAIHDLLSAEDCRAAYLLIESQQDTLCRPEVEVILEQSLEDAEAAEDEERIPRLALHLKLLRDCKVSGVAKAFRELERLPFEADLIPGKTIEALLGGPREKSRHAHYLAALRTRITDEQLKALICVIQSLLSGGGIPSCAKELNGVYKAALDTVVVSVMSEDIIRNTLEVLGSLTEWRERMLEYRTSLLEAGEQTQLVGLLDTVVELLKAGGNPVGLGAGLTGVYERTWQVLLSHLHGHDCGGAV